MFVREKVRSFHSLRKIDTTCLQMFRFSGVDVRRFCVFFFCVREVLPFERQCGARADVCCVGLPGAGACDGSPDATRRRRLGSFTASNGGDLWPQRGARESLLSGYSPGNATFVRYQAAPTARPTVTNAEPFILATRALWRQPRRAGGKMVELVSLS